MNDSAQDQAGENSSLPESAERIYFPELDGLRFVAFMMVYLFHGGVPQPIMAHLIGHTAAAALRENGGFGVQLFFILSGYLITTLLLREEARYGRISLRAFWIRRILRIWPLYYLVLAIGFGLIPAIEGQILTPGYRGMLRIHLIPFLAFLGNWSMALNYSPARLAQHSLERLCRGAVLLHRPALDRSCCRPFSLAARCCVDRWLDRGAIVLRTSLRIAAHHCVQHIRSV